jgi:hypothetical protein
MLARLPFCIPMSSHRNRERATNNNVMQGRFKDFPFFRFFFVSPRALCRLIFFSTRIFIAHFKNYKMQFSDSSVQLGGEEKKDVRRLLIISKEALCSSAHEI